MEKSDKKYNGFVLVYMHLIKELKFIFKDTGALLILVGAVIIYPVIYSFGYLNETMTDLEIGVVDYDRSDASAKYITMLNSTQEINVSCTPATLTDAKGLFFKNDISGVIVIPKNFEKEVLANRQADVSVYADASYFLKYKNQFMAASVVNGYFSGGIAIKRYMAEGKSFSQAAVDNSPLAADCRILYNPSGGYGSFVMPGIMLLILQQTLLIGIGVMGGSFSESKESPFVYGVKNRGREVLPFLVGRTGAYMFLSFFTAIYCLVFVHDWFNYPDKAEVIDVMMLVFPYVLSTVLLGIGVSTLFRHRESAIVFMVFLSPIALFLSGLSWPMLAMPNWLNAVAKILPSTQALPAYLRLRMMGVGITGVKKELIQLYIQAGIYGTITATYFYVRVFIDKRKALKK